MTAARGAYEANGDPVNEVNRDAEVVTGSHLPVQNVPRTDVPRCQCRELDEHDGLPCTNAADLDDDVVTSPAICTPCLFGCLP